MPSERRIRSVCQRILPRPDGGVIDADTPDTDTPDMKGDTNLSDAGPEARVFRRTRNLTCNQKRNLMYNSMCSRISAGTFGFCSAVCSVLVGLIVAATTGCDQAYPEVIVVNQIGDRVMMQQVSFRGCLWPTVLAPGKATQPQRCLPGSGHVAFKRIDVGSYCENQLQYGMLDGWCACDGGVVDMSDGQYERDSSIISAVPLWFNYRTISMYEVDYGDTLRIEVRADDLEQDFSVPGPYGH